MKYILPQLKYKYNAMEPFIDEHTMMIHHTRHHQSYIDNLNNALDKYPRLYDQDLVSLLKDIDNLPADIQTAVRNNGGGHYNHHLFWELLNPSKNSEIDQVLLTAIEREFGSLNYLKAAFSSAAITRFGSGWAWLIITADNKLVVTSTANQDTPLHLGTPILVLDVWEHAYYLKYQNRRPEYINAFWNIINWDKVYELYKNHLNK